MNEPENRSQARLWLRYAREDLEAAEQLIETTAAPRHVCFLAQQSAEKAIKAILVFCQIDFPKSHDLEALTNLIPQEWEIRRRNLDVSTLTEWAVEARYPGNWPETTRSDAQTALAAAKEILEIVAVDIGARG